MELLPLQDSRMQKIMYLISSPIYLGFLNDLLFALPVEYCVGCCQQAVTCWPLGGQEPPQVGAALPLDRICKQTLG